MDTVESNELTPEASAPRTLPPPLPAIPYYPEPESQEPSPGLLPAIGIICVVRGVCGLVGEVPSVATIFGIGQAHFAFVYYGRGSFDAIATFVDCALEMLCVVGGIALMLRRPWGRTVLAIWAWCAVGTVAFYIVLQLSRSYSRAYGNIPPEGIVMLVLRNLAVSLSFPALVLVVLRERRMRVAGR